MPVYARKSRNSVNPGDMGISVEEEYKTPNFGSVSEEGNITNLDSFVASSNMALDASMSTRFT